jgi:hydrogenase maturation protein HypF
MVEIINNVIIKLVSETGFVKVALSGGVFQNRILLSKTSKRLRGEGLKVLTHRSIPTNDGGISLGQAIIAGTLFQEEKRNVFSRTCQDSEN